MIGAVANRARRNRKADWKTKINKIEILEEKQNWLHWNTNRFVVQKRHRVLQLGHCFVGEIRRHLTQCWRYIIAEVVEFVVAVETWCNWMNAFHRISDYGHRLRPQIVADAAITVAVAWCLWPKTLVSNALSSGSNRCIRRWCRFDQVQWTLITAKCFLCCKNIVER